MKERAKVGVVSKTLDSKWRKTMEKGIEIVAVQPANSDKYLGMQVTENLLTANPDLNRVFKTADQMTLDALEALKSAKKEKKIVLIGFDATQETLPKVKKGEMDADIAKPPYQMDVESIRWAIKLVKGEEVPERIGMGTELIIAENADKFLTWLV